MSEVYSLVSSCNTECAAVISMRVIIESFPEGLRMRYELTGDLATLRIPAPQPPAEMEGLWKHTCFEAFVAVVGESRYHEFNFSPSGQWAAYAFSDYRVRRVWKVSQTPDIRVFRRHQGHLLVEAKIATVDLPSNIAGNPLQLGLAAVIEAVDGSCSYWALLHPSDHPDFHHRSGFVCILTEG